MSVSDRPRAGLAGHVPLWHVVVDGWRRGTDSKQPRGGIVLGDPPFGRDAVSAAHFQDKTKALEVFCNEEALARDMHRQQETTAREALWIHRHYTRQSMKQLQHHVKELERTERDTRRLLEGLLPHGVCGPLGSIAGGVFWGLPLPWGRLGRPFWVSGGRAVRGDRQALAGNRQWVAGSWWRLEGDRWQWGILQH